MRLAPLESFRLKALVPELAPLGPPKSSLQKQLPWLIESAGWLLVRSGETLLEQVGLGGRWSCGVRRRERWAAAMWQGLAEPVLPVRAGQLVLQCPIDQPCDLADRLDWNKSA